MRKTFFCIDAHTCGNPVRLVAGGGPLLDGASMAERRLHFLREFDWIRRGLMFEPRGHDMMSGSILYPPADPENDIGVLFIETSGCLPMCGHGTIGTVTIAIEEGLLLPKTPGRLRLETPAGLVLVDYQQEGNKVKSVKLTNIPSFLYKENLEVECPDLGLLRVDVAYGGNFYAIVDPQENFPGLEHYTAGDLIRWSPVLRQRLNAAHQFQHPLDANIHGLSHLLWTGNRLTQTPQLVMPFFMATRRSIDLPAVPALPHGWRSGQRKDFYGSETRFTTRALSGVDLPAAWRPLQLAGRLPRLYRVSKGGRG